MRRRLTRLVAPAVLASLVLVAAGCGGGGSGDQVEGPASGTLTVLGPWSGRDQQSFEAVVQGFMSANPGAKVEYRSVGDRLPKQLRAAIKRGAPPDVAAVAELRLVKELAAEDVLTSLDYMKDEVQSNLGDSAVTLGSVDGTLYGFLFKAVNKSTVWYNRYVFQDAGVEPPQTWRELIAAASRLSESGTPAYSIGGADGWTLTDLFENVYLREAGPDEYDKLAAHEIPWTDDSVKTAMRTMAGMFRDRSKIAGDPLQVDFPESVSKVFADSPEAAMVFEGDFVPNVVDPPNPVPVSYGRQAGIDYDEFPFPSIDGSAPMVVGVGDTMVSFDDKPVTKAFMEYLTTTEAAEIWAGRGWFASLNKDLYPFRYPDYITRKTAGAVSDAEVFRYDLSELQPPAFRERLSQLFRALLAHPGNIDGVATRMEEAAGNAYG